MAGGGVLIERREDLRHARSSSGGTRSVGVEQRQLVTDPKAQPDWTALLGQSTLPEMAVAAAPLLDPETFSASTSRDALGRVLTAISPDNSAVTYRYDEGGALQRVDLEHRGSQTVQTVVGEITYNARGQRGRVVYGPANSPTTTTTYAYDPQTFRLTRLSTIRESDGAALQGLHYHHDPVGNITDIRDTAQPTVYFQNAVVEAANSFTYDALYRLTEATGREHASQGTTQRTHEQLPIGPQPMTSDPSAMRRYRQRFEYDPVGNILKMQHIPSGGSGWTRHYQYAEDGNRLLATSAPGDAPNGPYSHTYSHDGHGSMTAMPHLAVMDWNRDDQLQHATAGTEQVYFQYAGGIRSRKFTEKAGSTTEERIYLGPFEIYRKRVDGVLDLERESLHISDGSRRICIVETKTVTDGSPIEGPSVVWRYQFSNHLGSAATEVTRDGDIISYEEYHPYGTSAYRAADANIDVSAKRYRYTGMERDEETGLANHGMRLNAVWLGRWISPDPAGLTFDVTRYSYGACSPVSFTDKTGLSPIEAVHDTKPTTPPKGYSSDGGAWVFDRYRGVPGPGPDMNTTSVWRWVEAPSTEDAARSDTPGHVLGSLSTARPAMPLGVAGIALNDSLKPQRHTALRDTVAGILGTPSFTFFTRGIPVQHNFPPVGNSNLEFSRYSLSFRDLSGHPASTSHVFWNRTTPASPGSWKGLRLDLHALPSHGHPEPYWHWNHRGSGQLGFQDHAAASPRAARFGSTVKLVKPIAKAGTIVAAGMDAHAIAAEASESYNSGDWRNTKVEVARVAGAWTSAWASAKAGAYVGAAIGAYFSPLGAAIGGLIGGIAAGILGYVAGGYAGEEYGEGLTAKRVEHD